MNLQLEEQKNRNPWRKKSERVKNNSHFKNLTPVEKQQIEMLGRIGRLEHKARILSKLRFITNEILCNCAYHEKNMEEQFKKLEPLRVPEEEKEIIKQMWELKLNIGNSLLKEAKELIKYVESCNNS